MLNLDDLHQFQEESLEEFHARLARYRELEAEAQEEFVSFIYDPKEEE